MEQAIFHPQAGSSRETKLDEKRSEEQRAQGLQTSKKTDKTKSKTAKSSADNTNNKKSQIKRN